MSAWRDKAFDIHGRVVLPKSLSLCAWKASGGWVYSLNPDDVHGTEVFPTPEAAMQAAESAARTVLREALNDLGEDTT